MRFLYRTLLCVLVLVSAAGARAALSPTAVIDSLHQSLIETMKDAQRLGIDGRYKQMQPILEKSFDFERMIAIAAGSYWTSADEAQRRRLLDAFTELSITTY